MTSQSGMMAATFMLMVHVTGPERPLGYRSTDRNRNAFVMTETELNVIAALAMIGLSKIPKKG